MLPGLPITIRSIIISKATELKGFFSTEKNPHFQFFKSKSPTGNAAGMTNYQGPEPKITQAIIFYYHL